jgi:hypothetical protein
MRGRIEIMKTVKLERNKILLALCLTLGFSTVALAAGTGTGNGGDGARAAYIEKLKAELNVGRPRDLPANTPGSTPIGINDHTNNPDLTSIYEWCARATSMLKREKQRALLQIQAE